MKSAIDKVDWIVEYLAIFCTQCAELKAAQSITDSKLAGLHDRLTDDEASTHEVRTQLSSTDELVLLRAACNQIMNQLRMNGLPENENKDTKTLVSSTLSALGIKHGHTEIVFARRIGRAQPSSGPIHHGNTSSGIRSIVVGLKTPNTCSAVVDTKKNNPNITAKQVNASFPDSELYINRHLPAQLHKLRDEVLKSFPHIECNHMWIANSVVYIRKSQVDRPIRVLPSTDLQQLSL